MNSVRRLASIILAAAAAFTFSIFSYATPSPRPTGTWQALGALLDVREGASATALDDGRVLVAGGRNAEGVLASTEVIAAGGASMLAAPMHVARRGHTATMLDDGRVLVTGGYGVDGAALASAEVFTPAANAWTLVPMQQARASH